MTKKETIQVLQSIEDRAIDFPNMTACDWVAIAAAKRHLKNSLEVKEVNLDEEFNKYCDNLYLIDLENEPYAELFECAKYFFELGLKAQTNIKMPNLDDIFIEDGIDPNSKQAKIFKESYYTALENLKAQKGE